MSEAPAQQSNGPVGNPAENPLGSIPEGEKVMFDGRLHKGPGLGQVAPRRPQRKMTKEEEKTGEYYFQQQHLKVWPKK